MSVFLQRLCMFLVLVSTVTLSSCDHGELPIQEVVDLMEKARKESEKMSKSWHEIMKWHAEEYFDDPKVIELCNAIEKENFVLVDKLIAEGANANAVGKDNMTPLLWAYPKNNINIFKRLLEAGADPNIQVTSDFGVRASERLSKSHECWIAQGISVLEMSATTSFSGYFKAVMEHGGNPNLISKINDKNETPLHTVVMKDPILSFNRTENVKQLVNAGADLSAKTRDENTPLTYALLYSHSRSNSLHYDVITLLIESGADWEDPTKYNIQYGHIHEKFFTALMAIILEEEKVNLLIDVPIDEVIKHESGISQTEMISELPAEIKNGWEEWRKKRIESYGKLIVLLKKKGADLDEAREDLKLCEKFNTSSEEERKIIDEQIEQRLKERRERKEQKFAVKAEE